MSLTIKTDDVTSGKKGRGSTWGVTGSSGANGLIISKIILLFSLQYGFNRISQVCETHIAGFNFMVLNNAFLIHHGFKVKESFHSAKDEENARNRDIFRTLKKELKIKYPRSTRHC